MIAIDANLLVYAHVSGFEQHTAARGWLEQQLTSTSRVALPWPSLLAFLRLVTNPRVFTDPEPMARAWEQVESWLDAPPTWTPHPTDRHRHVVADLLRDVPVRANDVPDAHLAALAIEHGLTLASTDRGFARFSALSWRDPLAA